MFFFIVFSRIAICVFAPECERHLLTVHDSQRLFFDMIREHLTSSNFCNGHTGDRRVEMGLRLKQRVGKSRSSSLSWHFTERPVAVGGVDTSPSCSTMRRSARWCAANPFFFIAACYDAPHRAAFSLQRPTVTVDAKPKDQSERRAGSLIGHVDSSSST